MSKAKKSVAVVCILIIAVVLVVLASIFVHLFVFPRTTLFEAAGMNPENVEQINITRNGYSDNIKITKPELLRIITDQVNMVQVTPSYSYEFRDQPATLSYVYTFRTADENEEFSVKFFDKNDRVEIDVYDFSKNVYRIKEYTVESIQKFDLDFFTELIPEDKWITPSSDVPPVPQKETLWDDSSETTK